MCRRNEHFCYLIILWVEKIVSSVARLVRACNLTKHRSHDTSRIIVPCNYQTGTNLPRQLLSLPSEISFLLFKRHLDGTLRVVNEISGSIFEFKRLVYTNLLVCS